MFKDFIDKILFFISVPKCVFCGEKLNLGELALCGKCMKLHTEHKARNCSLCSRPLNECDCTCDFLDSHYIHRSVKVYRYLSDASSPSNSLIYSQKHERRSDVTRLLSTELADSIRRNVKSPEEYIITSVPRRRKNIKKYGMDHANILAKAVAKQLSAEYFSPIISKNRRDQKEMHGIERMRNVNFDYKKNAKDISGRRVIIIDDVVTTGASMGCTAMLVYGLGAKEIIGASVAVAYKDSYIRFSRDDRFYNSGKGKAR